MVKDHYVRCIERGRIYNVLDKGFVRLNDSMGGDARVIEAASSCYAKKSGRDELIKSLMVRQHTNPFEHVIFTFEVKAPIFVLRQWMRHRTWSFTEVSLRYTEPTDWYGDDGGPIDLFCQQALDLYHQLRLDGMAKQDARRVLPVSFYSSIYATVDLNNLMKFLILRDDEAAQQEIRLYAIALKEILRVACPITFKAFEEVRCASQT